MGMLPMVEKGSGYCDLMKWPLFYMNDFSVMGLLVSHLPAAVQALENRGFRITRESAGVKISFQGREQIPRIVEALQAEKIAVDLTDLMDRAYQG